MASEEEFQVAVPDRGTVTAIRTLPDRAAGDWLFLYAPGAASNVNDRFGAHACQALARLGFSAVRFQFPYTEARKRRPDRPAVLEETWRAVMEATRSPGQRLAVGGRSMGGRIGSQVVAKGGEADALALFAYPLRAPGRPDQPRDQHLPDIKVPTLFCSGTRDAFGTPEELRAAASKVPVSRLHLLEGADHGFGVSKSSGRWGKEVWDEAVAALVDWLKLY